MKRNRLPDRRDHWLVEFEHEGHRFTGGYGRFENGGDVAELFINGAKFGSAAEASAQEAALNASLALQHGCPYETILHALTCDGVAGGPVGALLLAIDKSVGTASAGRQGARAVPFGRLPRQFRATRLRGFSKPTSPRRRIMG